MAVTDSEWHAGGPGMDTRILTERLKVFHEQTKDALFGHTIIGVAVGVLLFDFGVDRTTLALWVTVMFAVALARLVVYRGFPAEAGLPARSRVWAFRFEIIALVSGATFGSLPVLFVEGEHFKVSACILLVLAGMAGGALGTLSAHARAFRFYAVALIFPTATALAAEGQMDLAIIAALFVLTLVYFDRFSRRFESALVHQIQERLTNADLLENIRRQGEVLESVLHSMPNAIAVLGPDDRFLYQNDRFKDLFDVPGELLDGSLTSGSFNDFRRARGDFDHLEPKALEEQIRAWERLKAGAGAFGYMRTTKEGRILRVENHPMPGGGWVRSWIDATDAVRSAEETAQKSALLQLTLDNIDQGLSVVTADGVQVMANRRYCEMLDFPLEMMDTPTPLDEIIRLLEERGELFDMSDETSAAMDAWESGESDSDRIGYERRQKNGTWVLVLCRRLPDGGHVRTFTDITERKEAEREAQERRDLLESTLSNIEQGVIVRDADDNIQLYNNRLAELLKVPAEMYARNASTEELNAYHDTHHGQSFERVPPEVDAWFARKQAGLTVDRLEYQRPSADGRYLNVVFQPLADGGEIRTFSDITAVKAYETELREKTSFLEGVLGSLEQGVMVTDPDGRIELWNDRAFGILGTPPIPAPGMSDAARVMPEFAGVDHPTPEIEGYFRAWGDWFDMQAPESSRGSHEHQLPSGDWILVYDRDLPGGGMVRTLTDITDRRVQEANALAAKETAEETRSRMEAILESLPVGVLVRNQDLAIDFWNDAYCTYAGLSAEILDSHRSFDDGTRYIYDNFPHYQTKSYEEFHADRLSFYRSTEKFVRDVAFQDPRYDVQYIVAPLPDGGRVNLIIDITSQKQAAREAIEARDAAEETRERMRAILQTLPVGVLTYDNTQHIEFWNDAYCKITGFPSEAMADRPHFVDYSKYIFEAHNRGRDMSLERFMAYRNRVYGSEEPYSREFVFDLTGLDVQYMVSALPDGGRVNVIVDITYQKQAERTALEARDASEEATRAKSAFLAAMSHEIRTPMNGVMGMAEILQQSRLDEDQGSVVKTILDSGRSLLRIIDDILDFSKIEAGRMEVEAEPVDPRAVAEAVLDTVAPAADVKDLDLVLWIEPSVPGAFLSDPVRLRQILTNLIGNAVKFTDRGAVSVSVTSNADTADPSRTTIRFEIADTGIGIDKDRLGDLFEPFLQAESTTTRRFGGTGLGLTISRRLVIMMGGRIGVDSTVGRGSVFWFELPVEPASVALRKEADWTPLQGARVGVLASSASTSAMIQEILNSNGLEAVPVDSDGPPDRLLDMDAVVVDGRLGADCLKRVAPSIAFETAQTNLRRLWIFGHLGLSPEVYNIPRPPRRDALLRAVGIVLGRMSPDLVSVADPVVAVVEPADLPTIEEALEAGRLILVVEDNPVNQLVVRRQLALLGYAAEAAGDGVEALEMWQQKNYGLVLTDCHMPRMDGYQLAEAIRREEARAGHGRRVPVVALTANAMAGESDRCLAAGMDDYLAKPVALETMGRTLGRWLRVEPVPPLAAPDQPPPPESASDTGMQIDRAMLTEILGSDDPEFASAMLALFVESYSELVGRIDHALTSGDIKAVREASHAAKGAAANACAASLRDALQALEIAAAHGEADKLADLWSDARRIGETVVAEINAQQGSA